MAKSPTKKVSETPAFFEIGRFIASPGRKLCGFLIEAEAERAVFRRILDVAAKHNARLKFAHFQRPNEKKIILVFFDYTECDVSPQALADEIRKSRNVISVELIESPIEGFIIDTTSNQLAVNGVRSAICLLPIYRGLIQGARDQFGSGGAFFLYYAGHEMGEETARLARKLGQRLGATDPMQILRDIILPLQGSTGWGIPKITEFKPNPLYIRIKIYNSLECEIGCGAKEPYSHLTRGFIAGCVSELFGIKATVTETKCIAKGDPYCEFTIKPA